MKYSYDYSALQRFIDTNRLQKKDVLAALGTNDYVTLNKWINGEVAMHITAMMRLCNYYQWPLDNFFLDDDKPAVLLPASTEEAGGQPMPVGYQPGKRRLPGGGIVETIATPSQQDPLSAEARQFLTERDRRSREHEARYAGGMQPVTEPAALQPVTPQPAATTPVSESSAILSLKLQHAGELREIEASHNQQVIDLMRELNEQGERIRRECQTSFDAERNRLMDIINRQTAELAQLASRPKFGPYGNVADESHEGDENP